MKNIVFVLILLLTLMFTVSCGSTDSNEPKDNKVVKKVIPKVTFEFNQFGDVDDPQTQVILIYNNEKRDLGKFAGNTSLIEKSSYSDLNIPENAIIACQTWWAGAGDYFYVVPTKTGVEVFQGWADEQQEDEGYHWKKI